MHDFDIMQRDRTIKEYVVPEEGGLTVPILRHLDSVVLDEKWRLLTLSSNVLNRD